MNKSTKSLPFEKHCINIYSVPLIRVHHDSYFYFIRYITCESSFADVPFNVGFNPVKNINTGFFPEKINHRDFDLAIQDVFVPFLNKLHEAIEILKQPFFSSGSD